MAFEGSGGANRNLRQWDGSKALWGPIPFAVNTSPTIRSMNVQFTASTTRPVLGMYSVRLVTGTIGIVGVARTICELLADPGVGAPTTVRAAVETSLEVTGLSLGLGLRGDGVHMLSFWIPPNWAAIIRPTFVGPAGGSAAFYTQTEFTF